MLNIIVYVLNIPLYKHVAYMFSPEMGDFIIKWLEIGIYSFVLLFLLYLILVLKFYKANLSSIFVHSGLFDYVTKIIVETFDIKDTKVLRIAILKFVFYPNLTSGLEYSSILNLFSIYLIASCKGDL